LWWYPQIPDLSWVWPPMSIDLSFWREKFMLSIIYSPKINLISPDTFLTWWLTEELRRFHFSSSVSGCRMVPTSVYRQELIIIFGQSSVAVLLSQSA
jgi:hypothetical protein